MITETIISNAANGEYTNQHYMKQLSSSPEFITAYRDLEETYKKNYTDFAHKLRISMEAFAIAEETAKRMEASSAPLNINNVRRDATAYAKTQGYPNLLTALSIARGNTAKIVAAILHINHETSTTASDENVILDFWIKLFAFGSKNSHAGTVSNFYIPNKNNCRDYLRKFTNIVFAYYGTDHTFSGKNLPFKDYYPIPQEILDEHHIVLPKRKSICVRSENNQNIIYLFSEQTSQSSNTERREQETIQHLWTDNIEYPQNIINNAFFDSNDNHSDFCYWIYPLPTTPIALSDDFIQELTLDERLFIIKGIIKGISSMHTAEPPYYHRNISQYSFLIFRIGKKYKPILIDFAFTKDTSEDRAFTLFSDVVNLVNRTKSIYYAPELYKLSRDAKDVDWGASDIYSLGILINKILTNTTDTEALPAEDPASCYYDIISNMTSPDMSERVSIKDVFDFFQ